jgi:hypothetical protein
MQPTRRLPTVVIRPTSDACRLDPPAPRGRSPERPEGRTSDRSASAHPTPLDWIEGDQRASAAHPLQHDAGGDWQHAQHRQHAEQLQQPQANRAIEWPASSWGIIGPVGGGVTSPRMRACLINLAGFLAKGRYRSAVRPPFHGARSDASRVPPDRAYGRPTPTGGGAGAAPPNVLGVGGPEAGRARADRDSLSELRPHHSDGARMEARAVCQVRLADHSDGRRPAVRLNPRGVPPVPGRSLAHSLSDPVGEVRSRATLRSKRVRR